MNFSYPYGAFRSAQSSNYRRTLTLVRMVSLKVLGGKNNGFVMVLRTDKSGCEK
jgi:hypothetical protein